MKAVRLLACLVLGALAMWAALGSPPTCTGGNPVGQAILDVVCRQ